MTTVEDKLIDYPSSDGQPMAETEIHVLSIFSLYEQLRLYYESREDVFIAADMFWYWAEGDRDRRVAPDIMVVPGVPNHPPRRSFFSWREGAIPALVIEFASRGTWRDDIEDKHDLYEQLGVSEYVIFDPEARYLVPPLQCHRLKNGTYRRARLEGDQFRSALGFGLRAEDDILRMVDLKSGGRVLTGRERAEVEQQRAEVEQQRARAQEQRADTEQQRADQLQAEVERLKALLQQRGESSS